MSRPKTLPDTPDRVIHRQQDMTRYFNSDPLLGWARTALNNARKRAQRKGLGFNITLDDVLKAAEHATHCPITGQELIFGRGNRLCNNSASIDRIDNDSPYDPDAIAVISMRANAIKNNATIEEMVAIGRYATIRKDAK